MAKEIKYTYELMTKCLQLTDPDKDMYCYGYDYFKGTDKEFSKYFKENYIGNDMFQKCIGINKEIHND